MNARPLSFLLKTSTALSTLALLQSMAIGTALANPQGGQVVAGEATIAEPNPTTVQIDQSSNRAVIEWQSFNIAPNETTRFNQPSVDAWALNRVVGSQDPSRILGTLTANGNIAIVNPDGVVFGQGSRIDVHSLIATTHDISNDDFMAGRHNFTIPGNPTASIVNEGEISIADHGIAAFVAPGVRNSGVITARFGQVALGAANAFTLDLYGDGLINLMVDDEIAEEVIDVATGKPMAELVKNDGKISADGGVVALKASTARKAVDSVINSSGVVEARTIADRGGRIVFGARTTATKTAGAPRQRVRVSGRIDASALVSAPTPTAKPKGGRIEITGEEIEIASADLDASGPGGGGTVLIGGDYMGGNGDPETIAQYGITIEPEPIPTAAGVTLASTVTINADATDDGKGGKVIVWSDGETRTAATITARGGSDGGFIETSGRKRIVVDAPADASAPRGKAGTWLVDPNNLTLTNTTASVSSNTTSDPNTHTAVAGASLIDIALIETALNAGTDVSLLATGDITADGVSVNKTAGGDATLLFNAGQKLELENTAIASTQGKLNVSAFAPNIVLTAANITTNGGAVFFDSIESVAGTADIATSNATFETGGGNITFLSAGAGVDNAAMSLTSTTFKSSAGDITVNATDGAVSITKPAIPGPPPGGPVESYLSEGGDITITASGTLTIDNELIDTGGGSTTGDITLASVGTGPETTAMSLTSTTLESGGGKINIDTTNGSISITKPAIPGPPTIGPSDTYLSEGGDIAITAGGTLTIENELIQSSGGNIILKSTQAGASNIGISVTSTTVDSGGGDLAIDATEGSVTLIKPASPPIGVMTYLSQGGKIDVQAGGSLTIFNETLFSKTGDISLKGQAVSIGGDSFGISDILTQGGNLTVETTGTTVGTDELTIGIARIDAGNGTIDLTSATSVVILGPDPAAFDFTTAVLDSDAGLSETGLLVGDNNPITSGMLNITARDRIDVKFAQFHTGYATLSADIITGSARAQNTSGTGGGASPDVRDITASGDVTLKGAGIGLYVEGQADKTLTLTYTGGSSGGVQHKGLTGGTDNGGYYGLVTEKGFGTVSLIKDAGFTADRVDIRVEGDAGGFIGTTLTQQGFLFKDQGVDLLQQETGVANPKGVTATTTNRVIFDVGNMDILFDDSNVFNIATRLDLNNVANVNGAAADSLTFTHAGGGQVFLNGCLAGTSCVVVPGEPAEEPVILEPDQIVRSVTNPETLFKTSTDERAESSSGTGMNLQSWQKSIRDVATIEYALDSISVANVDRIVDIVAFFLESKISDVPLAFAFSDIDDFYAFSQSFLGEAATKGLLARLGTGIALDVSEDLILSYVESRYGKWSNQYTFVISAWDLFVLSRALFGDVGAAVQVPLRTIDRIGETIREARDTYKSNIIGELTELEYQFYQRGEEFLVALRTNSYNGKPISPRLRKLMIDYIREIPKNTQDLIDARTNPILNAATSLGRIFDLSINKIDQIIQ